MIDLEERVGAVLHGAADNVTHSPLDPGRPRALARRRRRNRRVGQVTAALVLLVGLGVAFQAAVDESSEVQTADEDGLDGNGIPVDTGAELSWSQVDEADGLGLHEIIWTGEQFAALGQTGDEGQSLFFSPDGRAWEPATGSLPDDYSPQGISVDDGWLVVWGIEQTDNTPFFDSFGPILVFATDDDGTTWSDLGQVVDAPVDDDQTDFVSSSHFVDTVAVEGGTVMALVRSRLLPDVEAALVAQNLAGPDDVVGVEIVEWTSEGEAKADYCLNPVGDGCEGETETVEFPSPGMQAERDLTPEIWVSVDGAPFEQASEIEGATTESLASTQGKFFRTVWADGRHQLLVSDDNGTTWTPIEPDEGPDNPADGVDVSGGPATRSVTTEGDDVILVDIFQHVDGDVDRSIQRSSDGGQTWQSTPMAITPVYMDVGPGGYLATGYSQETNDGVVDTVVSWLAQIGGADTDPPGLIGWSADGEEWGWQDRGELFGSDGWAVVSVGVDTAVVLSFPDPNSDNDNTKVFVADIPS